MIDTTDEHSFEGLGILRSIIDSPHNAVMQTKRAPCLGGDDVHAELTVLRLVDGTFAVCDGTQYKKYYTFFWRSEKDALACFHRCAEWFTGTSGELPHKLQIAMIDKAYGRKLALETERHDDEHKVLESRYWSNQASADARYKKVRDIMESAYEANVKSLDATYLARKAELTDKVNIEVAKLEREKYMRDMGPSFNLEETLADSEGYNPDTDDVLQGIVAQYLAEERENKL